MSIPSKVKFHITEAGPKKCVAVKACPLSPDAPHYENYIEAARVYESQLEATHDTVAQPLNKQAVLTYESLQNPQPEDIDFMLEEMKLHFYEGVSNHADKIGVFRRDLWFDNQAEYMTQFSQEDYTELLALRKERDEASPEDYPAAVDKLNNLVAKYKNVEVRDRYFAFLTENLPVTEDRVEIAKTMATSRARSKYWERLLENRIGIPPEIAHEFEETWNADEFTEGSKLFFERELRVLDARRARLDGSDNREALATKMGYRSAKHGYFFIQSRSKLIRSWYRTRGRGYALTVNRINKKFSPFEH